MSFKNTFGMGLHPNELLYPGFHSLDALQKAPPFYYPLSHQTHHSRRTSLNRHHSSDFHICKDGFRAILNVEHFRPNEITVKTADKNTVIVEAKHKEQEDDHGYISRHFIRRYSLPENININCVESTLSSDGVLTITAPSPTDSGSNERIVQIKHTGEAHHSSEDCSQGNGEKKKTG